MHFVSKVNVLSNLLFFVCLFQIFATDETQSVEPWVHQWPWWSRFSNVTNSFLLYKTKGFNENLWILIDSISMFPYFLLFYFIYFILRLITNRTITTLKYFSDGQKRCIIFLSVLISTNINFSSLCNNNKHWKPHTIFYTRWHWSKYTKYHINVCRKRCNFFSPTKQILKFRTRRMRLWGLNMVFRYMSETVALF